MPSLLIGTISLWIMLLGKPPRLALAGPAAGAGADIGLLLMMGSTHGESFACALFTFGILACIRAHRRASS